MLSVTARIRDYTQPRNGFVPRSSLRVTSYNDSVLVDNSSPVYSAYAYIQGTAVDYLTRFLSGTSVQRAFGVPLLGAQIVNETEKANEYLQQIRGLDRKSILAACRLVGYDVAYRRGKDFYTDVRTVNPDESIISNIVIMVRRGLAFLEHHKPVVFTGFTFEGGYTTLISTGDGDFLTKNGLWDFKTSQHEPTSSDTLQILVYYILGYHSVYQEFRSINSIGIFNPFLNRSYEISIADIPETVLRQVSHDVIGYQLSSDNCPWHETNGEDEQVLQDFLRTLVRENTDTDFDPDNFRDGIHEISVDDYWTYFRKKSDRIELSRPKFNRTDHILFLKHSGFLMFVSVSAKGSTCILQGGSLRKLEKPLEYYYKRMPEYGARVLSLFSKYWDAIYRISDFVRHISPENLSARVHGCIVDLDFFNHIYLNPINGSVSPYTAESMYKRHLYPNLFSLISDKMPSLLPEFKKKQLADPYA